MNIFSEPLIMPLVSALGPKSIVKTGCKDPDELSELLSYCKANDSQLHLIEPRPSFDESALEPMTESGLVFHRLLELNALHSIESMDLVILEGNPNWYTVLNSLRLIDKGAAKHERAFPCVLIHSVGWPYARRDCYPDPEVIPEAYRQPYKKLGLAPGQEELCEEGGLFSDRFHAVYANELHNGVLTAVEDFTKENGTEFRWLVLPAGFGLGLLFPTGLAKENTKFSSLVESLSMSEPALKLMEATEWARIEDAYGSARNLAEQKKLALEERTALQEQIKKSEEQGERFREELEAARQKNKELLESEKAGAGREKELEAEVRRNRQELDATEKRASALEMERDRAREGLQHLGERIKSLEGDRDRLLKTNEELQRRLDDDEMGETAQARLKLLDEQKSGIERELEVLKQRLGERNLKYESLESVYRSRMADIQRLINWMEKIALDVDRHLHSWTWKVGSQVVDPVRRLMGKKSVPVESLRISKILNSYKSWKTGFDSR